MASMVTFILLANVLHMYSTFIHQLELNFYLSVVRNENCQVIMYDFFLRPFANLDVLTASIVNQVCQQF